jgi:hypothetical protein
MDQMKNATRSSTAQRFISDEITKALARAGLSYDHPIREDLDAWAEIVGVRDAVVRIRDERAESRLQRHGKAEGKLRRDLRWHDSRRIARAQTPVPNKGSASSSPLLDVLLRLLRSSRPLPIQSINTCAE